MSAIEHLQIYGHLPDFGLLASSIGLVSKENPHNSVLPLSLYHRTL